MGLTARLFFLALFAVVLLGGLAIGGTDAGSLKRPLGAISREMIWNADREAVQTAKQRCSDLGGQQLEECFAYAMEDLGASHEAVSFTRALGDGVFLRKFREAGRVDVAYVVNPFRANDLRGVLLVNGEPPIVDVDDISSLPKEGMEQDRTYIALKKSYPKATLWPGDRSSKYPLMDFTSAGGQEFVVPYTLRNSCHSCEVLGTAYFGFDFDKEGTLSSIRFLRLEQLPKKAPPKNEVRKETEQIRFIVMTEEGKEFTVRLDSNRSTGFQWRPAEPLDERFVKLVRSEYVPFDTDAIGAGGEEIWTFLATGKGETEFALEYVRPWERNRSDVKTATIKVWVKAAATK
jgi:predicted secreted protein